MARKNTNSHLLSKLNGSSFPLHSDENFDTLQNMLSQGYILHRVCPLENLGKPYEGEPGFIFIVIEPSPPISETKIKVPYGPQSLEYSGYVYFSKPDSSSPRGGINRRRLKKLL